MKDALSAQEHCFRGVVDGLVKFKDDILGACRTEYDELRSKLGKEGWSYSILLDEAGGVARNVSHDPAS